MYIHYKYTKGKLLGHGLTFLTHARYSREISQMPYLLHALVGDGNQEKFKVLFKLKEVEMRAYMHTLLKMMSDYNSVHDRNASL